MFRKERDGRNIWETEKNGKGDREREIRKYD